MILWNSNLALDVVSVVGRANCPHSTLTERVVVVNKTYINLTQPSFARQFRHQRRPAGYKIEVELVEVEPVERPLVYLAIELGLFQIQFYLMSVSRYINK